MLCSTQMTPALLGKKVGMTRVYDEAGTMVPVTIVKAGPCLISQVKTADGKDGYHAVQLGFEEIAPRVSNQAQMGHAAKAGAGPQRHYREIRLKTASDKKVGETIDVKVFEGVGIVDVIGTGKGKGYQGVMKRHHFGGLCASHGTERKHRSPGSIGSLCSNRGYGGGLKKGKRMAGHMGDERVTVRSLPVVRIDSDKSLLLVKGPVPGANGGTVMVRPAVRLNRSKGNAGK